jgi:exopolysaccharide biosynthesis polyprenyl glycosylphosphotransferase
MYKQYHPYKIALIVADFWITVAMLFVAEYFRPFLPGLPIEYSLIVPNYSIYFFAPFLFHVLFALTGVYDYKRISNLSLQISRLTFSYSLGVWMFAGLLFFTFRDTSRLLVIYFSVLNYTALVGIRCVMRLIMRKRLLMPQRARVLVLGERDSAKLLTDAIRKEIGPVFEMIGFMDFESDKGPELPLNFLGTIKDLPQIIEKNEIQVVIIATQTKYNTANLESLVARLVSLPVRIYLAPDYVQLALVEAEVEQLGNIVLIGIREPVIRGGKRFSKRIMDIVISLIVFLLTWPMFVVIWIAIKLDSKGPGIFSALRVGEGGKTFKMYKFRTMAQGAESLQQSLTQTDGQGRKIYKMKDDPRVTLVGRFLRRTSLDELPQLFNVLKGEMSLVGPRPEQPFITKEYDTWQWQRILVPPGVTGWWQISGRSDLPMHLNTNYDVYYVKNYSIALDLKILLMTIIEVLKGKGAY